MLVMQSYIYHLCHQKTKVRLCSHIGSFTMGMSQNLAGRFNRRRQDEAAASMSSGDEEKPDHNNIPAETSIEELTELKIPFQSLAVTTATSQISSLVFCLAWSVRFNFYESTATHCRVDNYLPSLSATLDFTPQRDVWRACIGLSGIPRYFIAYLYYNIIFKSKVLLWFHWIEITALIGLSIVDSIRYFGEF